MVMIHAVVQHVRDRDCVHDDDDDGVDGNTCDRCMTMNDDGDDCDGEDCCAVRDE